MKTSHDLLLRLIALFKFLKAAMLIALGVGAFKLLHKNVGEMAEHWVRALRLDPGNRFVEMALTKAWGLKPGHIKEWGFVSFLYAVLFLIEGTGLWLERRWGEWMTVIITSTLLPVEIYEIYRHPTAVRVAVFLINGGIVGYLIWRIRNGAASKGRSTAAPGVPSMTKD